AHVGNAALNVFHGESLHGPGPCGLVDPRTHQELASSRRVPRFLQQVKAGASSPAPDAHGAGDSPSQYCRPSWSRRMDAPEPSFTTARALVFVVLIVVFLIASAFDEHASHIAALNDP